MNRVILLQEKHPGITGWIISILLVIPFAVMAGNFRQSDTPGHISESGLPVITNYNPDDYRAFNQAAFPSIGFTAQDVHPYFPELAGWGGEGQNMMTLSYDGFSVLGRKVRTTIISPVKYGIDTTGPCKKLEQGTGVRCYISVEPGHRRGEFSTQ